jgi:hypothetical protein
MLHLLVCLNFGLQGRVGLGQLSCPGPHPLFEACVCPAEHRLIFLLQPLQFLCRNVIDAMGTLVGEFVRRPDVLDDRVHTVSYT